MMPKTEKEDVTNDRFRILNITGSCPTNKGVVFYCPQVKIDGEWKCIHGKSMGRFIESVQLITGIEAWKDKELAEKVIAYYKSYIR